MGQSDPIAQREKVFRFAGTGGADNHGVEAVSREVLRSQDHILELTAGFHSDRNHRPSRIPAPLAVSPQPVEIEMAGIVDSQCVQQLRALAVGRREFLRGCRSPPRQ